MDFPFFDMYKRIVLEPQKLLIFVFFIDLRISRCFELDSLIWKISASISVWDKFHDCSVITNGRNFTKLYTLLQLNMIWCWLNFEAFLWTADTVGKPFTKLLLQTYLGLLCVETRKTIHNVVARRKKIDRIWTVSRKSNMTRNSLEEADTLFSP